MNNTCESAIDIVDHIAEIGPDIVPTPRGRHESDVEFKNDDCMEEVHVAPREVADNPEIFLDTKDDDEVK